MNIIKAKLMDGTGKAKGRAYTYKSIIDVKEGDIVVADMAGGMKRLRVVETGIPQSEIEGLDYEIKLIDHVWDGTEESEDGHVELRIETETMPEVSFNYDTIKAHLAAYTTKYENLVVTEASLKGCKATQKEMAGLRAKLNRFRIDTKKKMAGPLEEFDAQCKELTAMIEAVEKPIKDGIAKYDDKRRERKREDAAALRLEVIEETGLDEAHAKELTLLDKYGNLGAKKSDVKMDLAARARVLKEKQDKERELREIIVDAIEIENKRLKQRLSIEDFGHLFKAGASTKTILEEVRSRAEMIYNAENPKPEPEPEPEPPQEEPERIQGPGAMAASQDGPFEGEGASTSFADPSIDGGHAPAARQAMGTIEPTPRPTQPGNGISEGAIVSATYQCVGAYGELKRLSAWLRDSAIRYKAVEQKVLEP